MPRKEISYYCDLCGRKFNNRNLAIQCESNHFEAKEITGFKYDLYDNKSLYPISVNIKLVNKKGVEKTITYVRKQ